MQRVSHCTESKLIEMPIILLINIPSFQKELTTVQFYDFTNKPENNYKCKLKCRYYAEPEYALPSHILTHFQTQ